ncbi:hypothetical protein [Chloracidobacterium thermophilum]|uniref:hypothetical protein n=1 Tax=Chloracidobacterium thermophilum TaxID=458033 RepID=UPI00387E0470
MPNFFHFEKLASLKWFFFPQMLTEATNAALNEIGQALIRGYEGRVYEHRTRVLTEDD